MEQHVVASPSKIFFVSMLTRDIELRDAILDLLDNCVDGILRQLSGDFKSEIPYNGYWAKITASPTEFSIQDNCGGIPRDIALNSAFRLGRADLERDKHIATVGMYGIGMKRALFKMGRRSKVISQHQGDAYSVEVPPEWLDDDSNWTLEMVESEALQCNGTTIIVRELYPNIAYQFDDNNHNFLENLRTEISNLFAQIIKKGFTIFLNGEKIEGANLNILFNPTAQIQPYAYKATFSDVEIELAVGFYRKLASESEIEEEQQLPRKRSDQAGWTVICNDRVVLYRDKSEMTGWGIGNVPKYHTQFIAIAGILRFTSHNSLKLPLNTTKRGLDTSSSVYWHIHKYMMEGLKKFTDFTNRWKGRESEANTHFRELSPRDATEIAKAIPLEVWNPVRGSEVNAQRFTPDLPKPPKDKLKSRISFFRLKL